MTRVVRLGMIAFAVLVCAAQSDSARFSATRSPLIAARGAHTATLLPDGQVLIAGGSGGTTASAELFDPGTQIFTATGNMIEPRSGHTATLLYSGKVLIVGGNFNSSAELYDPLSGRFFATGRTLTNFLGGHTAILLPDGKVLVVGGTINNEFKGETHAEVYDPATGSFSVTGNLALGRTRHRATLLPNGRVLITGGSSEFDAAGNRGWQFFASTEIYNPETASFSAGPNMTAARFWHTATLMPNGRVLIAGGAQVGDLHTGNFSSIASAELYDLATGQFTPTVQPMSVPRDLHSATLLPGGDVLIAGGESEANFNAAYLATAETYNAWTGQFRATAGLLTAQSAHTATLLEGNDVLLVGGVPFPRTAEIYEQNISARTASPPRRR